MPKLNPFHRDVLSQYVANIMWAGTLVVISGAAVLAFWLYNTLGPEAWPDRDAVTSGVIVFVAAAIFVNELRRGKAFARKEATARAAVQDEVFPPGQKLPGGPWYTGSDIDINFPPPVFSGDTAARGDTEEIVVTVKQGRKTILRDRKATQHPTVDGQRQFRIPASETKKLRGGRVHIQPTAIFTDGSRQVLQENWFEVFESL